MRILFSLHRAAPPPYPPAWMQRTGRTLLLVVPLAVVGATAGALSGFCSLLAANAIHGEFPDLPRAAGMATFAAWFGAPLGAVLGPLARLVVRRTSLLRLTLILTAGTIAGATTASFIAAVADEAEATLFLLIPAGFVGYVLALAGCWIAELNSPAGAQPGG